MAPHSNSLSVANTLQDQPAGLGKAAGPAASQRHRGPRLGDRDGRRQPALRDPSAGRHLDSRSPSGPWIPKVRISGPRSRPHRPPPRPRPQSHTKRWCKVGIGLAAAGPQLRPRHLVHRPAGGLVPGPRGLSGPERPAKFNVVDRGRRDDLARALASRRAASLSGRDPPRGHQDRPRVQGSAERLAVDHESRWAGTPVADQRWRPDVVQRHAPCRRDHLRRNPVSRGRVSDSLWAGS